MNGPQLDCQAVGRVLNDIHLEEAGHQLRIFRVVPLGFLKEQRKLLMWSVKSSDGSDFIYKDKKRQPNWA